MQRNSILSLALVITILPSLALAEDLGKYPKKYPDPPAHAASQRTGIPTAVEESGGDFQETVRKHGIVNVNVTVLPEITTPVDMSATDLNRISCPVDIKDALTSTEKGLVIKIAGKDAFVKFKVLKTTEGKFKYTVTPTEIFVVCGENTYSLIALPKKIPSQIIRLGSGAEKKIQENQSIYGSLPFEKKVIRAIKDIFTEQIPDSYSVTPTNRLIGNYQEFSVLSRRSVDIEGEGLRVVEMEVTLKPGNRQFKLNEKLFLNKQFTTNPVAISLEKQVLSPGESIRVFVVEQRPEKHVSSININQLEKPAQDDSAEETSQKLIHPASRIHKDFKAKGGDESSATPRINPGA